MKILVITDLYPIKDDEKCTPRTIYDFVQEWKKSGHEVKVIKPNFILNSFLRRKPFYKSGIYGDIENINYWLPFIGKIKNKIKSNLEADIVIAHMPSGLIFANKLGLNFCAGVHVSDLEVLRNPVYKIYFRTELEKAYQNAQKIACRSFVLKDKFLKLYSEYAPKTFVAPSGIQFKPVKRTWNPTEKIKVLTCGQLIKRKNIDKVIHACEGFENIELTVIGSGEEEKYLKKIAGKPHPLTPSLKGRGNSSEISDKIYPFLKGRGNSSEISDKIYPSLKERGNSFETPDKIYPFLKGRGNSFETPDKIYPSLKGRGNSFETPDKIYPSLKGRGEVVFMGHLSHEEVLKKMSESDIFILPSVNETFGMVYLEAMAEGCITVCTKGDGIDGIIKDSENGFLTEVDKVEETIQRILDYKDKNAILENTYNTVLAFNERDLAEQYLQSITFCT